MKNISEDTNSNKEAKRKEYRIIRNSSSTLVHEKIKYYVKSTLKMHLAKPNTKEKFIGIYWPLKGEVDIRFIKESSKQKVALPSSCKNRGINYYHWSNNQLTLDSNRIPSPDSKNSISPKDISILLVPALSIDLEGYRLGYGGGYFDRLRQKDLWYSIPSFVVLSSNCISTRPLPRDKWDLPFNGWISENGLHKIKPTE